MTSDNRNDEPRRRAARAKNQRGPARRPIKVTPRRKADIDPHLVALVYYLIAARLVRDAETEQPRPEAAAKDEPPAPERPEPGTEVA